MRSDLEDQRQVSRAEVEAFIARHGGKYIECSAKTGHNVNVVFEELVEVALTGGAHAVIRSNQPVQVRCLVM